MFDRKEILEDKVLRKIFKKKEREQKIYQNINSDGQKENTKERFIDFCYSDKREEQGLRHNLEILFFSTYEMENKLQKDVYEFGLNEIESLLCCYQSTSINSMNVKISLLKKYVDFCIRHSFRSNPINFFEGLNSLDYVYKNMWQYKYPSKEVVLKICENIPPGQMTLLLIIPFLGIVGQKTCEIRNLKETDIDLENKSITVREYDEVDDKTGEITHHDERIVKIDDEFIPYIKCAIDSAVLYEKSNRDDDVMTRRSIISPFNPYLIKRSSKSMSKKHEPIGNSGFCSRFAHLKAVFQGEPWLVSKLTTITLEHSGMMEELRLIEAEKGELDKEDYMALMRRHQRKENSYPTIKKLYEEIRRNEEQEKELLKLESMIEYEI
ncbi:hypothetical protein Z962_06690 [Clostridium botulinum C/D str. BKT12695]|nr:hypothetical protein Z962_06690 [Clostridium botulinum C/D str. BKT12695]